MIGQKVENTSTESLEDLLPLHKHLPPQLHILMTALTQEPELDSLNSVLKIRAHRNEQNTLLIREHLPLLQYELENVHDLRDSLVQVANAHKKFYHVVVVDVDVQVFLSVCSLVLG